ncbi:MAG: CRISPR-associated endonuclease Cas2 [Polyangiaceae bacterium]|nr:CRISPR-associated endonuclease Cas2 [Polyangiaceae bacterium]
MEKTATRTPASGVSAPEERFTQAEQEPRRERTTLYVVVFDVHDARRRARVRRIIASFGFEVGPGAFEVPTSRAGARALERALALELVPEDRVRMYPVCSRCRDQARLWGDGELAGLSPAIIF